MKALFRLIERIGHATLPVLLLGETGTGKEVVAEWVHAHSGLAAQPLLRINCAGLTEAVVESELFGHERGAFTGAVSAHRGLFEAADGGTLLLDELAELPLRTQAKLLRVLEAGEFTRLGSNQTRRVKVRFIAATHRPLPALINAGAFRNDLYYRLNGARLQIPPLRERPSEILPLARHFLGRHAGPGARLDAGAQRALLRYHWPGNVRELRNVIEYAAALSPDQVIVAEQLDLEHAREAPPSRSAWCDAAIHLSAPADAAVAPAAPAAAASAPVAPAAGGAAAPPLRHILESFERQCIESALARVDGNQTRAARELGISRRGLTNKLAKLGIGRPRRALARAAAPDPARQGES